MSTTSTKRGQHNRGKGSVMTEKMKRSRLFAPSADLLPHGWSPASVTQSPDRAVIAYARAVTGKNILSIADAAAVMNSHGNTISAATLYHRARDWWRDYGRHVHERT